MIIRHSFLYLLARGLPGLVNFAALALYTRLLSPQEYGQYSLVLALVSFLQMLLFGWLNLGVLRFLPRFANRQAVFFSTILAAYGIIALFGLGACLLGWLFIPSPVVAQLVLASGLLLAAWAFFELNLQLQNSQLNPYRYGGMMLGKTLLALGIGGSLAWATHSAAGILWGLFLGNLLPLLVLCRREWQHFHWRWVDKSILLQMLAYGLPLTASALLNEVINSSDRLLLAWLDGVDSAGQYAVAYDLPRFTLVMLMMSINLAIYPMLVNALEKHGMAAAREHSRQHALLLSGIALPAAAGLVMITPNLAALLIGAEFRATVLALTPLIAAAILLAGFKSYFFDLAFQLGKHTQSQVWILLVAAGSNLLLNLLLIPHHGMFGAAWATFAAYAVGLLLSAWQGRHWFPLPLPGKALAGIVLATLGMSLALYPLHGKTGLGWLALQLSTGCLAYAALLLMLDTGSIRAHLQRYFPFIQRSQQLKP